MIDAGVTHLILGVRVQAPRPRTDRFFNVITRSARGRGRWPARRRAGPRAAQKQTDTNIAGD